MVASPVKRREHKRNLHRGNAAGYEMLAACGTDEEEALIKSDAWLDHKKHPKTTTFHQRLHVQVSFGLQTMILFQTTKNVYFFHRMELTHRAPPQKPRSTFSDSPCADALGELQASCSRKRRAKRMGPSFERRYKRNGSAVEAELTIEHVFKDRGAKGAFRWTELVHITDQDDGNRGSRVGKRAVFTRSTAPDFAVLQNSPHQTQAEKLRKRNLLFSCRDAFAKKKKKYLHTTNTCGG